MKVKSAVLMISALAVLPFASVSLAHGLSDADQPGLGDLQTFEVKTFDEHASSGMETLPPELTEYAREAMKADERLRFDSPAEGVLQFSCSESKTFWGKERCGRIRAEVTIGKGGPVVWSTVREYRPLVTLQSDDPKGFAKSVVRQLGDDYRKALKAVPFKIQIQEDSE